MALWGGGLLRFPDCSALRPPLARSRRLGWRERGSPGARGRTGPTFLVRCLLYRQQLGDVESAGEFLACALILSAPGPRRGVQPRAGPGAGSDPRGHRARRRGPARGRGASALPPPPAPLQTLLRTFLPLAQFNKTTLKGKPSFTHYVFGVKRYQHLKPHCPLGPKSWQIFHRPRLIFI